MDNNVYRAIGEFAEYPKAEFSRPKSQNLQFGGKRLNNLSAKLQILLYWLARDRSYGLYTHESREMVRLQSKQNKFLIKQTYSTISNNHFLFFIINFNVTIKHNLLLKLSKAIEIFLNDKVLTLPNRQGIKHD